MGTGKRVSRPYTGTNEETPKLQSEGDRPVGELLPGRPRVVSRTGGCSRVTYKYLLAYLFSWLRLGQGPGRSGHSR